MEIEEVFKSPFKLILTCPPYFSPVALPGFRYIYKNRRNRRFHNTKRNIRKIPNVFKTNNR